MAMLPGNEDSADGCTSVGPATRPLSGNDETHGLPGMTVKWSYALHHKGQLGHVVHRNGDLECAFDSEADRERFAAVWLRAIGKEPVFEPL
jgi:hypothetical protein